MINGDAFSAIVGFGEFPSFTQVVMFRKSQILGLHFPVDMHICEDTVFALRAFMRGGVIFNRNILAEIRRHGSNATKNYSLMAIDKLKALQTIKADIRHGHLLAYNDRLVKAYIDATRFSIITRGLMDCIKFFIGALFVKGSFFRKIKGGVKLRIH